MFIPFEGRSQECVQCFQACAIVLNPRGVEEAGAEVGDVGIGTPSARSLNGLHRGVLKVHRRTKNLSYFTR